MAEEWSLPEKVSQRRDALVALERGVRELGEMMTAQEMIPTGPGAWERQT